MPVPEARRAQPVSRPRQGRGTRYPRSEGRAVGPQRPQRARGALQRGHAHRQACARSVRSVHLLHWNSVKHISPAIAPASLSISVRHFFCLSLFTSHVETSHFIFISILRLFHLFLAFDKVCLSECIVDKNFDLR